MKTIHPKNLSNEDLIESLIYNLRRDPGKDVSIIVDELKRRLSDPTNTKENKEKTIPDK